MKKCKGIHNFKKTGQCIEHGLAWFGYNRNSAPVKQEKKYITLKMPEPRKGEIKLAGGYVVEFYNECGLCSKEVKYGEKHNCQPPKSKGRDDTEYAKGIIKGREMQYKLDKLGEPPQTDKTTWNEDYINIKGFQDVALDVYRGKLIKGIGKSKNLLTKNYGYKTDVFILRDEILTLIKEEK